MPPPLFPMSNGNIVECSIRGRYMGQRILNVLHYRWIGGSVSDALAEIENLTDKLSDPITGPWGRMLLCMNDLYTAHEFRTQIIYPIRRPYVSAYVDETGGRANESPMPPNSGGVVVKRVNIAGRGRHGGVHVTAMNYGDQSSGVLTEAYKTLLNDLAQTLITYMQDVGGADNWEPVTWSKAQPTAPALLIGVYPGEEVRIVRRRTVGVGE